MDIQELIEIAGSDAVHTFITTLTSEMLKEKKKAFESGYEAGAEDQDCVTQWLRYIEGDD